MEPESDNVGSQDAADVPSSPINDGEAENPSGPSYVEEAENSAGKSNQKRATSKLRARSKAFKKTSGNKSLEAKNARAAPQSKGRLRKVIMEPESDNEESQGAAHVPSQLPSCEKNKNTMNPSSPVNGVEAENSAGKLNEGPQSQKRAPGKRRTRSKTFKKSAANKLVAKNAKAAPQSKGGFQKRNKTPLQSNNKESNKTEHVVLKETPTEEGTGKNQANRVSIKGSKYPIHWFKESNKKEHVDHKETPAEENTGTDHKEERHVEEGKKMQKNDDTRGTKKRQQKQRHENTHERSEGTSNNQIGRKKSHVKEKRRQDEGQKEKLGGLIFMCNAKTKPDCFHYRVMGVSMPKKDMVLSVERGLKLFLYDFDLKLMYGIYEASSSGGLKLEPKAFGGGFPAQVRFSIYEDCFPLSESVFKKAINDNYFEKNKFRAELTVRQVQKLSQLFRPVVSQPLQAVAVPVHPSAIGSARDRERYRGVRDLGRHLEREDLHISSIDDRGRHPLHSNDMDRHPEYREVIHPQRQETPCNLYMSEREYRTYGLLGERRSLGASQNIESASDPYIEDREPHAFLRQQDAEYREAEYRDSVAAQREVVADPLYMAQRESYMHDRDPFDTYRYGREEVPSTSYYADNRRDSQHPDTDLMRRMESDRLNQLYIKYAVDAPPSNYNQVPRYTEIQRVPVPSSVPHDLVRLTPLRETLPTSVSSRYSFAGPSLSYR